MSAALASLKGAIRDALAADMQLAGLFRGQKVHDHPPPSASFPYCSFGRASIYDWSTATEPGTEIVLTLDLWSRARTSAEVSGIAGRIQALIQPDALAPAGFALANLTLLSGECTYDANSAVHHGALTFRAVLEPDQQGVDP